MNNKEQGTAYEKYIQQIFTTLHRMDGIENPKIQQNVVLPGRSGTTHQIDVFWEFAVAGISYRVAIECKNWSEPIPQNIVAAFQSVVADLGPGTQGILVSSSGFTSGAVSMGKAAGIRLMEIRPATDKDYEGRVTGLPLRLVIPRISSPKTEIQIDKEWAEKKHVHAGEVDNHDGIRIHDYGHNEFFTVQQLISRLCQEEGPGHRETRYICSDDAWLVDSNDKRQIKIREIHVSFDYEVESISTEVIFTAQMKQYIKDLTSGKFRFIGDLKKPANEENQ